MKSIRNSINILPGQFRLILAVAVVFFHTTRFVHIGHFAVYCFFMLSGYWVSSMYESKYQHLSRMPFTYYISRLWRLLPVYWIFALLIIIFKVFFAIGNPYYVDRTIPWVLAQIFIVGSNQLDTSTLLLTPAWSLDIEIQFYLIFPVFFVLLKKQAVFLATLLLSSVILVLLFFVPGSFAAKSVLFYLPFFLIGMYLYKYPIQFAPLLKMACMALFFAMLLLPYYEIILFGYGYTGKGMYYHELYNLILPVFLIPFIQDNVHKSSDARDRWMGNMSYVVYFSHWLWFFSYYQYSLNLPFSARIVPFLLYLTVTFLTAYLVNRFFDQPIDAKRRDWLRSFLPQ